MMKKFLGAVLGLSLVAGVAAASPGMRGGQRHAMKEQFDANKDGKLDDAERAAMKKQFEAKRAEMKAKRLAQFDANKNGQLDDSEKQTMHTTKKLEHFKKLDANGDGKITQDEFLAAKGRGHKHAR